MRRKWIKRTGIFLLIVAAIFAAIYLSVALTTGKPAESREFFMQNNSRPLVFAHRGGGGLAPENTLQAFERAFAIGVDVIEIDVRATADGELIVLHDATVDRTTNGAGAVNGLTLAELKKLDAGFRWTPDGAATFPFRAQNVTIPTLDEVFKTFPLMRFNIEPKQETPSIIEPLCRTIRERQMTDKIVVGSFSGGIMDEFRSVCPEVATSAAPLEVTKFLAMYKTGLTASFSPQMQALQIPDTVGVTKEFVHAAHERNLGVHVWTVNEPADMRRLLDAGVDGIMTDYPDRLLKILGRGEAK